MRSVRIALVGALVISSLAVAGCRNRVAEERDALWKQSREQQAELDRKNAELEAMRRASELRAQAPQNAAPAPAPSPAPTPPPAPPKPVAQIADLETTQDVAGNVTVNLPSDVFFDSGANTIRPAGRQSLDKVAAALKKDYAGKRVRIEGHTDSDPIKKSKWASNQALSEARAAAVRDYLVKKGIDAGSISTLGHGSDKPRGSDKARNRRVEIVVLGDASAPGAPRPASSVDNPSLNK